MDGQGSGGGFVRDVQAVNVPAVAERPRVLDPTSCRFSASLLARRLLLDQ